MEILIFCLIVSAAIHLVHEAPYAVRGKTSPRMQLKMAQAKARAEAAGTRPAKPGRVGSGRHAARDFFSALWGDIWDDAHVRRGNIRTRRAEKQVAGTHWRQKAGRGVVRLGRGGGTLAAAGGIGVWKAGTAGWQRLTGRPVADEIAEPPHIAGAGPTVLTRDRAGRASDQPEHGGAAVDPGDHGEGPAEIGGFLDGERVVDRRDGSTGTVRFLDLTPEELAAGGAPAEVVQDGGMSATELELAAPYLDRLDGGQRTDAGDEPWAESEPDFEFRDGLPSAAVEVAPVTERNTAMPNGTPTGETTNITTALEFEKGNAEEARNMVTQIELASASLAAGEVSGKPIELLGTAQELLGQLAATFDAFHSELERHHTIGEAYASVGNDAGNKKFNTLA